MDGGVGIGGKAGRPSVPSFLKSKGCMLCSRFRGEVKLADSSPRGGELALLLATTALACDEEV